jgi:two-component system nitrogen regulation response regulator GlnG
MSHILIVDDEAAICWGLQKLVARQGHSVDSAGSAETAFELARQRVPDLIVLDVRLPGIDGLTALGQFRKLAPQAAVIIITAFGDLETAVAAVGGGAFDYLTKPFDLEQAASAIERGLRYRQSAETSTADATPIADSPDELLGRSAAMQEVFKRIALVADSDATVLITGESGTGKELVARALHRHSRRKQQAFVPVHLAALSPTLVESELFGHVKGSFTGAETSRMGLLELAQGATVFFDEAGDIPLAAQVKLLRVLEDHQLTPVGQTEPRHVDFRAIAATNRDLKQLFREGNFRQDLFFRLATFEIALPPLRERGDDIPLLAERFLQRARLAARRPSRFSDSALAELCRRRWPGNVRELRNAVEHAALVARGETIEPEHLPPPLELASDSLDPAGQLRDAVRRWVSHQLAQDESPAHLHEQLLSQVEPPLFDAVLALTANNRAAAADILGIHRATLRKKLR